MIGSDSGEPGEASMKVILLRDVARLGRKSEVKDVPSGHALNFLIPQKLAIPATPENVKKLKGVLAQKEGVKSKEEERFAEALQKLGEKTLAYNVDANEKGHLYKGIGTDALAQFLSTHDIRVHKEEIQLEHPIKSLGEYEIILTHGTQRGICRISVCKK